MFSILYFLILHLSLVVGGVLRFDGSNDYIDAGQITFTDTFTLELWFDYCGSGDAWLVSKHRTPSGQNMIFYVKGLSLIHI